MNVSGVALNDEQVEWLVAAVEQDEDFGARPNSPLRWTIARAVYDALPAMPEEGNQ